MSILKPEDAIRFAVIEFQYKSDVRISTSLMPPTVSAETVMTTERMKYGNCTEPTFPLSVLKSDNAIRFAECEFLGKLVLDS